MAKATTPSHDTQDSLEILRLMAIQVEDGSIHSTGEAIQLVIDFLREMAVNGDVRAIRYCALLAGVDISIRELAASFERVPTLRKIISASRDKSSGLKLNISNVSIRRNADADG